MNEPGGDADMAREANGVKRTGSGSTFDLVIVGGGIIGLSAARDAALRGLRVALVEKEDYGWG
ncbi:MAG: FAD-dependent oxidoreductase, partial [Chloroflexota bacterium]